MKTTIQLIGMTQDGKVATASEGIAHYTDALGSFKVTENMFTGELWDTVTIETKKGVYDLVEVDCSDGISSLYRGTCHTTIVTVVIGQRTGYINY